MINIVSTAILVLCLTFSLTVRAEVTTPPKTKEEVLVVKEGDFVLGNKDAKLTIFEYSSLACPHCAEFHLRVFPEFKKNYVDTGKVRYVIKEFPMNPSSTFATLLLGCVGDKKEQFLNMLLEAQHLWAFTIGYKVQLQQFARLGGMSDEDFNKCINNEKKKDEVVNNAFEASRALEISHTPTFFINNKRVEGSMSYQQFAEKVDQEMIN